LRVLAAGVDSVYASVADGLAVDRLADGLAHRGQAQDFGEDVPWEILGTDRTFLVKPRSFRTYNVWLSSPAMDLRIGPDGQHRPPGCLELRSAFIHQVGVEAAVEDAERVLAYFFPHLRSAAHTSVPSNRQGIPSEQLPGHGMRVSRIDVYADVQGWEPTLADHGRFMARAISRRAWEQNAEDRRRQILMEGRTFCGFTFGHGDVVGRIYDKTRQLKKRQETWLSLRVPLPADANRWRWPVAPAWKATAKPVARGRAPPRRLADRKAIGHGVDPVPADPEVAERTPAELDLVRRRLREANHLRLVQGYVGYLTSLGAMGHGVQLDQAVASVTPVAERYLDARGRTFEGVTIHKRERNLAV